MKKKQKILAIAGPSASGKTALAIGLAKKLDGEIISADSRLIYKDFDIATAKPTFEEREGIPHYLIDIKLPTEDYSVAEFQDDAKKIIKEISDKNKVPIIAGGTGLYFRTLLQDFDLPRVAPNEQLRNDLEQKSSQELYQMLYEKDSEAAQKIHENNKVKIIRALEVCLSLGIPMSEAQKKKESQYATLWIGLNAKNRSYLYDRINKRVDIMMSNGLVDETKNLIEKYGNIPLLNSTIGYQELLPHINNEIPLEEAIDAIKQNTRRYAKRQLSWFNSNSKINWYNIDEINVEQIISDVIKKWNNPIEPENY